MQKAVDELQRILLSDQALGLGGVRRAFSGPKKTLGLIFPNSELDNPSNWRGNKAIEKFREGVYKDLNNALRCLGSEKSDEPCWICGELRPRETLEVAKGTYRRISPLKNSLLISVLPNVITKDLGHFSRNLPPDTDIIPFTSEHYMTYLQGVFTISLMEVGRFEVGKMRDLSNETLEAHKNELQRDAYNDRVCWLPKEKRIERVKQVIQALARLRGGAHLTQNLSDVNPVIVLVSFVDGGNASFERLFNADENNERVVLNLEHLASVLADYKDRLLKPDNSKAVVFGYRPTVLANEEKSAAGI